MIPVLIPATKLGGSDGFLCGNLPEIKPNSSNYFQPEDDRGVQVVPPEALQSLLKKSGFLRFERRFGEVPGSEVAEIVAAFALIEEWRSDGKGQREQYLVWKRLALASRRKEQIARGERSMPDSLEQYMLKNAAEVVQRDGLPLTVTALLNRRGDVRVWWNRHLKTPCPGIFVGSFVEALRILLLLNLSSPDSIAICPGCRKQFVRTKTTHTFHSIACGNRNRKARQRSKEREAEAAHGTRKTR